MQTVNAATVIKTANIHFFFLHRLIVVSANKMTGVNTVLHYLHQGFGFDVAVIRGNVGLQVCSPGECAGTNRARVNRVRAEGKFVNCKSSQLAESFSTSLALMALLTGVCPHMVSQVVLSLECFITNLAWKWSFVGVNPFMNL